MVIIIMIIIIIMKITRLIIMAIKVNSKIIKTRRIMTEINLEQ